MPSTENRLIGGLGPRERKRLVARCELFDMALSEVLGKANARTRYAYFPVSGFVSLVVEVDERPGLEVGMVGNEGMLGADQGDTFHVTHQFLAFMLGVRRVGVTLAAGELQRQGLIAYRRGQLTVLDRLGLQVRSCSCYDRNRRVYDLLLP